MRYFTLKKEDNLIWIDMEMSGLDFQKDTILEIATIVTNKDLEIVAEGPVFAIYQPEEVLNAMDEWNTQHHNESGLVERVRTSTTGLREAEEHTLNFLKQYTLPRTSPLCGNSIYQDRLFMRVHMPTLEGYLHYRNIDVSTIKELVYRWYPNSHQPPPKRNTHRALDDIRESITELQFYRSQVFV